MTGNNRIAVIHANHEWLSWVRADAMNERRKLTPGGYEDCMDRVNRQSCDDYGKERTRR